MFHPEKVTSSYFHAAILFLMYMSVGTLIKKNHTKRILAQLFIYIQFQSWAETQKVWFDKALIEIPLGAEVLTEIAFPFEVSEV